MWLGEFVEPFLNFLISEVAVAITLTSGGVEDMMYRKPVAQSLVPECRCNNRHFSDKEQSPVRPGLAWGWALPWCSESAVGDPKPKTEH